MKRLLLLATLLVTLSGCAVISQWTASAKACIADDSKGGCFEQAVTKANNMKVKITEVAGVVSPLPWIPTAAGCVGGGIVFVVSLVLGGKKKNEVKP